MAAAIGVGLLGAALLGLALGPLLHASLRYPLLVAAVFASMMALVAGTIAPGYPFTRFGAANHVTTARVVLVALVAGLVPEPAATRAAWFVVAATALVAALDGLDGRLARRTRMASAFGARFDMEVDAFFILLLSVQVWRFDKAGAWVLGCGLMRYAFVAAGWAMPWMARPLTPTFRAKVVAVVQLLGLAAALAPVVPSPFSDAVAGVTLAALTWSFAVDVRRLQDPKTPRPQDPKTPRPHDPTARTPPSASAPARASSRSRGAGD